MAIIRRVTRIANPRKTKARRKAVKARHKRRVTRNPVLLEFGVLNPRKTRRKSVAKKRRKARRSSNPRRHAVARVHHRRRRSNHRRRRNPMTVVHNRRHHRRRNPMGFGSKQLLEMSGGMLIGVAAAKYIPTLIPAQVLSAIPASSFTAPVVTAIGTGIAAYLASKFLPGDVAKGVALGGSALVLSQVLNVVAPPNISGPLALAGIGDIVATQGFAVPDRSMRAQVVAMPSAGVSGYGSGGYRKMIR